MCDLQGLIQVQDNRVLRSKDKELKLCHIGVALRWFPDHCSKVRVDAYLVSTRVTSWLVSFLRELLKTKLSCLYIVFKWMF